MRARRTDENHKAVTAALRRLGYPHKSLHTQGGGVEDLLVGVRCERDCVSPRCPRARWVLLEIKNRAGRGVRFTPAQREWYEQTEGFPRIVATSAEDAIRQLRAMEGV